MNQSEIGKYQEAANIVNNYAETNSVNSFATDEEVSKFRDTFLEKFSPDKLANLPDSELLRAIFLNSGNKENLCYVLEFDPNIKNAFGGIGGGSAFKYSLFQSKETGKWTAGIPKNPKELSEQEALELGKSIRDDIIKGYEIIKDAKLDSESDYENLQRELDSISERIFNQAWIRKYFYLVFPEKFIGIYWDKIMKHYLYGLGITPSNSRYGKNGQLSLIQRRTNYNAFQFQNICNSMFEDTEFCSLKLDDISDDLIEEWKTRGIIALKWNKLDDLQSYCDDNKISVSKLANAIEDKYETINHKDAIKIAQGIKKFKEKGNDTVFALTTGKDLIGIIENNDASDSYLYEPESEYAHVKKVHWREFPKSSDFFPDEIKDPVCTELRTDNNLLAVYKLYFQSADLKEGASTIELRPVRFNTGLESSFSRNRIFYGAPGTGKSYTLNQEKDNLLSNGGEYERVTFYSDYTYAHFVGAYKPVPYIDKEGKELITYKYVPGPFMRLYAKALKNSREDNPKPFLLIIEEMNRANVAGVFGEIFQLLDRDYNGISEYSVHASEETKRYLASTVGGDPEDYSEIALPDNMFIWATLNNADQGVFPLDTAFKRRWDDYNYLGIDDNEDGIIGKTVILGEDENRRLIEWNALRKAINEELLTYRINEDKLIGPYFLSNKEILTEDILNPDLFKRVFKNKVLMYLFEDAARQKRASLFSGCEETSRNQFSRICKEFDTKGVNIFCESINSQFTELPAEEDSE